MAARSRTLALLVLFLTLLFGVAAAKNIEDRKWRQISSEHFTIHSTLTRTNTQELLRHLEAIHAMFLGIAGKEAASKVPLSIFALDRGADYEELGLPPWSVGLFVPGLSRNSIVIHDGLQIPEKQVIIHEYAHYLLHSLIRFPFPDWFQEGYASYLETTEIHGKYINVGKPNIENKLALSYAPWLPWQMIVDTSYRRSNIERNQYMFYAQSWLLVHYLYNRLGGETSTLHDLQEYRTALQAGVGEIEAFEQAFGIPVDNLQEILQQYHSNGQYRYLSYPIEPILPNFSTQSRTMTREEISVELGRLIVDMISSTGRKDKTLLQSANRLFDVAANAEATRAQAQVGIGVALYLAGQLTESEQHIADATALAPSNYRVQLDAARYYLSLIGDVDFFASLLDVKANTGTLERRAERCLVNATKIDGSQPELAFLVGAFMIETGIDPHRGVQLVTTAAMSAPADHNTRLYLARTLMRMERYEEALLYAEDLLLFTHQSPSLADQAQRIIETVQAAQDN